MGSRSKTGSGNISAFGSLTQTAALKGAKVTSIIHTCTSTPFSKVFSAREVFEMDAFEHEGEEG